MRAWLLCLVAALAGSSAIPAGRADTAAQPPRPDFTGTWTRDATRSEHFATAETLVVSQSASEVKIQQILCCRQAGEVWITTYSFNQWGPRAATPGHISPNLARKDEKPTQVKWDGPALVFHSGPAMDVRGGSVRVWRLSTDGRDLLEDVVNRGLGVDFDFKDSSIPAMYPRDKHVYTRAAAHDW